MESINQKLTKLHGDVNELVALYDYAEQLYRYDNIREQRSVRLDTSIKVCYSSMRMNKEGIW